MEVVMENTSTLVEDAKSLGLKINQKKTKVNKLLEENVVINDFVYEKFKIPRINYY